MISYRKEGRFKMLSKKFILSLSISLLVPFVASLGLAQSALSQNVEDAWKDLPFEEQFIEGCTQGEAFGTAEFEMKQQYCSCAFQTYKSRYTPNEFMQINSVAISLGEHGPHLVSLMLKPELEQCSSESGYES